MQNPFRQLLLPNGLTLSLFDHTTRYYGDYHFVRLRIECRVPVTAALFTEEAEFQDVLRLVGDEVVYSRTAEQMGVPSGETEQVLNRLAAGLEKNALPYLGSPLFPRKLVLSQLTNGRKASQSAGAGPSRFDP